MAKDKKRVFFCQNCGYESGKWMGQCPACKEWNTFVEEVVRTKSAGGRPAGRGTSGSPVRPVAIRDIGSEQRQR
ncbi:MAG: DNA repair protein RadA, partial [Lachnospiraceae bacterium]